MARIKISISLETVCKAEKKGGFCYCRKLFPSKQCHECKNTPCKINMASREVKTTKFYFLNAASNQILDSL